MGLEWLLLANLISLHGGLLVHVLLLLAHGLSGGERHALARHLPLLLVALHHKSLHVLLALAVVHKAATAVIRRQRALAHLLHLIALRAARVLLLRLVRIHWLLAVLPLEAHLGHLQTRVELVSSVLSELVLLVHACKVIAEVV